jgi:NADPH2:quinone reductase
VGHAARVAPSARRAASHPRARAKKILGSDFSGTLDALGEGVSGWALGEEVFGLAPFRQSTTGTYAEYHLAPASLLRKPDHLTHVEAAAVPLAAATADTVLVKRLALRRAATIVAMEGDLEPAIDRNHTCESAETPRT